MSRIGITAKDVVRAAENLVLQGLLPTPIQIRKYLGHGSSTTVQKYFRAWQNKCYRDSIATINTADDSEQIGVLELEHRITKLKEHNDHLSQELIVIEQELMRLRSLEQGWNAVIKEWEHKTEVLQEKLTAQELVVANLTKVHTDAIEQIINDKNKLIELLRKELKEVNQQGLEQIRAMSYKGHELLMEEKAKNINLQTSNKELEVQLKTSAEALANSKKDNVILKELIKREHLKPCIEATHD